METTEKLRETSQHFSQWNQNVSQYLLKVLNKREFDNFP